MREPSIYTRRKREEDVRVLATIPLRDRAHGRSAEQFRVIAKRYGGNDVLDLRTYYQDGAGEWRPSPRGALLPRDAAAVIIAALGRVDRESTYARTSAPHFRRRLDGLRPTPLTVRA